MWILIQIEAHSITATGLHEILAEQLESKTVSSNIQTLISFPFMAREHTVSPQCFSCFDKRTISWAN